MEGRTRSTLFLFYPNPEIRIPNKLSLHSSIKSTSELRPCLHWEGSVDRVNGERKLPFRFYERGSHMDKYAETYEYISGIRWKIFTSLLSMNLVLLKLLLIFTKLALLTSGLK